MFTKHKQGFTLIELLTVIAIIGILAGMIVMGMSRAMEKAKLARCANTLNQIRNSMVSYFTDNRECFPPAYGFLIKAAPPLGSPPIAQAQHTEYFFLKPYMAYLKAHRKFELYDEFSVSHDTNADGQIQFMEYSPIGTKTGPETYVFDQPRVCVYHAPSAEEANEQRPFVYMPVSQAQAKQMAQYYWNVMASGDILRGATAAVWDNAGTPQAPTLNFPPPRYDAFVLVSVGPNGDAGGVVPNLMPACAMTCDDEELFNFTALRGYYLATRDLNSNGTPDFDFRGRVGGAAEDATPASYEGIVIESSTTPKQTATLPGWVCMLPSQLPYAGGEMMPGPGPIILKYP
ncbi:MAG: hypothetical protein QG656_1750 [Candidatus Hydrogenedentes bacterium]|nr:hypothetical protein [Candidatus Hydrogenedentota bacterium]